MIDIEGPDSQRFIDDFDTSQLEYFEGNANWISAQAQTRPDHYEWEQWIIDNKVTCSLTQNFSDQDFDFYVAEEFVDGVYQSQRFDVTCHSEDEDAL